MLMAAIVLIAMVDGYVRQQQQHLTHCLANFVALDGAFGAPSSL